MELILTRSDATTSQVTVTCDGQSSHTFDLSALIPLVEEANAARLQPAILPVFDDLILQIDGEPRPLRLQRMSNW